MIRNPVISIPIPNGKRKTFDTNPFADPASIDRGQMSKNMFSNKSVNMSQVNPNAAIPESAMNLLAQSMAIQSAIGSNNAITSEIFTPNKKKQKIGNSIRGPRDVARGNKESYKNMKNFDVLPAPLRNLITSTAPDFDLDEKEFNGIKGNHRITVAVPVESWRDFPNMKLNYMIRNTFAITKKQPRIESNYANPYASFSNSAFKVADITQFNLLSCMTYEPPQTFKDVKSPAEVWDDWYFQGSVVNEGIGADEFGFFRNTKGHGSVSERVAIFTAKGRCMTVNIFGNDIRAGANLYLILKKVDCPNSITPYSPTGEIYPIELDNVYMRKVLEKYSEIVDTSLASDLKSKGKISKGKDEESDDEDEGTKKETRVETKNLSSIAQKMAKYYHTIDVETRKKPYMLIPYVSNTNGYPDLEARTYYDEFGNKYTDGLVIKVGFTQDPFYATERINYRDAYKDANIALGGPQFEVYIK
jgi:hypothetical protein